MNQHILKSDMDKRSAEPATVNNSLESADVINYLNGEEQRICPIARWELEEIFSLFQEVAFKVQNIEDPTNVTITFVPFDDYLKIQLLNDTTNDYYFVLNKIDFNSISLEFELFFVTLAKSGLNYYFYLQGVDSWVLAGGGGGGTDPISNGTRIPNPPVTPPPAS